MVVTLSLNCVWLIWSVINFYLILWETNIVQNCFTDWRRPAPIVHAVVRAEAGQRQLLHPARHVQTRHPQQSGISWTTNLILTGSWGLCLRMTWDDDEKTHPKLKIYRPARSKNPYKSRYMNKYTAIYFLESKRQMCVSVLLLPRLPILTTVKKKWGKLDIITIHTLKNLLQNYTFV